jgi:tRNA (guanine37-N1)-methyltransferase
MHIQIIAVFPEIFEALNYGIPGRAQKKGKITIELLRLRDFSQDKHRRIDDRPYGGGPGMVIKAFPVLAAIKTALKKTPPNTLISYLSPHGKRFDQESAYQLSQRTHLILVAGRYEGIDERIYAMHPHEIWSLGDFVLSGGEPAILCMIDAISRLIPGVLNNQESAQQDSFNPGRGLLDHPHYTRPASVNGLSVPSVLLRGNHQAIAQWRGEKSLKYTRQHRPDLLKINCISPQEPL